LLEYGWLGDKSRCLSLSLARELSHHVKNLLRQRMCALAGRIMTELESEMVGKICDEVEKAR
jgi:hypothetical protein